MAKVKPKFSLPVISSAENAVHLWKMLSSFRVLRLYSFHHIGALCSFFPTPNLCVWRNKNPQMASVSILNPAICPIFFPAPQWRRPWRTSAPSTDGRASLRPPRPWKKQPCAPESRCVCVCVRVVWVRECVWGGVGGVSSLNNWLSRQADWS